MPRSGTLALTELRSGRPFEGVERIAVVRLSALGDVLAAVPAVQALRHAYPSAHLTWIVEPRCAALIEGWPAVDEVLEYPVRAWKERGWLRSVPSMARWYGGLARRRFDLVVDFQSNIKSATVTFATRASRRLGHAAPRKEPHRWATTHRLALPDGTWHRTDRDRLLAAAAGASLTRGTALEGFGRWNRAAEGPVVLHPGTSTFMPHKRWPLERFVELARALEGAGHPVRWSYGPEDAAWLLPLLERHRAPGRIPGTPPPLTELVAWLRESRLLVVGDTAPLHLASLLRTPTVALFGPTDARLYYPLASPEGVAYRRVPCSPCRSRGCEARHCLEQQRSEAVARTCLEVLSRFRATTPLAG